MCLLPSAAVGACWDSVCLLGTSQNPFVGETGGDSGKSFEWRLIRKTLARDSEEKTQGRPFSSALCSCSSRRVERTPADGRIDSSGGSCSILRSILLRSSPAIHFGWVPRGPGGLFPVCKFRCGGRVSTQFSFPDTPLPSYPDLNFPDRGRPKRLGDLGESHGSNNQCLLRTGCCTSRCLKDSVSPVGEV